jgi:hypothetical protein
VIKHRWGLAVLVVLGLVAGCGGTTAPRDATPSATTGASLGTALTAATITAGQAVPQPRGAAVLTVTGKITRTNKATALGLDLNTLEMFGITEVKLYEPWVKKDLDFRGVWLEDVLEVAGAAPDAATVHLVAHDDYVVDLTMAEVKAGGVMIATRSGDGSAIPIDSGGPTRIVFANGVAAGSNPDLWIWSLKTVDVR